MASVWCAAIGCSAGRRDQADLRAVCARRVRPAPVQTRGSGGRAAVGPPPRGHDLRHRAGDRSRRASHIVAMDYLTGGIGRARARRGGDAEQPAMRQAAAALDSAPQPRRSHRDIKLVNLLLDGDDRSTSPISGSPAGERGPTFSGVGRCSARPRTSRPSRCSVEAPSQRPLRAGRGALELLAAGAQRDRGAEHRRRRRTSTRAPTSSRSTRRSRRADPAPAVEWQSARSERPHAPTARLFGLGAPSKACWSRRPTRSHGSIARPAREHSSCRSVDPLPPAGTRARLGSAPRTVAAVAVSAGGARRWRGGSGASGDRALRRGRQREFADLASRQSHPYKADAATRQPAAQLAAAPCFSSPDATRAASANAFRRPSCRRSPSTQARRAHDAGRGIGHELCRRRSARPASGAHSPRRRRSRLCSRRHRGPRRRPGRQDHGRPPEIRRHVDVAEVCTPRDG